MIVISKVLFSMPIKSRRRSAHGHPHLEVRTLPDEKIQRLRRLVESWSREVRSASEVLSIRSSQLNARRYTKALRLSPTAGSRTRRRPGAVDPPRVPSYRILDLPSAHAGTHPRSRSIGRQATWRPEPVPRSIRAWRISSYLEGVLVGQLRCGCMLLVFISAGILQR